MAYTTHERVVLGMMLDKKMLSQLLTLPDEQLLQMLQLLSGGTFPMPDGTKMRRLRAVLDQITDADIERIGTLAAVYQNTQ